jgi:predicted O-methyltransferase YrrM
MNLEKALNIQGFTSQAELEWLAKQAANRKIIVEVGSWKGRSTRAMSDNSSATIFAVDTWEGSDEERHKEELRGKPKDWLLRQFEENLKDKMIFGLNPDKPEPGIFLMVGESVGAAESMKHFPFRPDMIFIDAAHDFESVKADLKAWMPLLAEGGLLCGHDYDAGRPGVVKAVRELVPNVQMAEAGSIWYSGKLI